MQDGSREGRFSNAHCGGKVTALGFDKKQRRLLTAGNDASIKLWNFNNGSLLRRWGPGVRGVGAALTYDKRACF